MRKLFSLLGLLFVVNSVWGQSLFSESFPNSGLLTSNSWTAFSGGGTSSITTTNGLSYTGYSNGLDYAAVLGNAGGEDVGRTFASQSTNGQSIYFSMLVNVTDASVTKSGDYFFVTGSPGGATWSTFNGRIFVKVTSSVVNFGVSATSTATYGTTSFSKNVTYLLIMKYTINTSGTDPISLWVLPSGNPTTEGAAGTPEVTISSTSGTNDVVSALGLRQGNASNSVQVVIDGIRAGLSWTDLALPVSFSSINATNIGKINKVTWSTASEEHNRGFDVQRSTDGVNYTSLGFVNSLSSTGNSSSTLNYSFIDYDPIGLKQYYRLKQTDFDGTSRYSGVVVVTNAVPERLAVTSIYPNPASSFVHLSVASPSREAMQLIVTDANGRTVRSKYVNAEVGNNSFEVEVAGLGAGIYYLSLRGPLTGWQSVGKFVKN